MKELLKRERERGTRYGKEIEEAMKEQRRVSTGTILAIVASAMSRSGNSKFLIDGFPRDTSQAFAFEKEIGKCHSLLHFDDPEHVMRERLAAQDVPSDVISRRLEEYAQRSLPLIEFYSKLGLVKTISTYGGSDDNEHIFQQVRECLEPSVVFVLGGASESAVAKACSAIESDFGYAHLSASKILADEAARGTPEALAQVPPTAAIFRDDDAFSRCRGRASRTSSSSAIFRRRWSSSRRSRQR